MLAKRFTGVNNTLFSLPRLSGKHVEGCAFRSGGKKDRRNSTPPEDRHPPGDGSVPPSEDAVLALNSAQQNSVSIPMFSAPKAERKTCGRLRLPE